jgi:Flp pilus assembly protein TadB
MTLMAIDLDLAGILIVSTIATIGVLLVGYAIAGWYERRARRRRESRRA